MVRHGACPHAPFVALKEVSVRGDTHRGGLMFLCRLLLSYNSQCHGACPHAPFVALKEVSVRRGTHRGGMPHALSYESHFSYCENCFPDTAIICPFLRRI